MVAALIVAISCLFLLLGVRLFVRADNTAQTLPFSQNWTSTGQITANDNWSGVPGIEGFFLRNDAVSTTAVDPQTILGDTFGAGTTTVELDVIANQSSVAITNGGVAEFDGIANPTIALQGSGTADAPFILINLNTTGQQNINVSYNLRDIDSTADNAVQPVALQFRAGNSGNFTNVPAGFVADATTGPSSATLVTPVNVTLPAAADNQPLVQVRIMTTNAASNDEWVGIDDINITGSPISGTPTLNIGDVTQAEGDAGTTTFNFLVTLNAPAGASGVSFTVNTQDGVTNPANAGSDYVAITNGSGSITQGNTSTTVSVTVNGDTTPEPNETFFVNISNITGANAGDVQGLGTINNDDVTITPIHDIQGPGASSPLSGSVTTRGIVTGVKTNGFFIQEPDATVDANPLTSEGIFVFTSSAPPAAAMVGNSVQVTGTISEFVPSADPLQPPLTELTSPTVTLLSSGNPLPTAIPLNATFPDPAGVHDQLERVEGMRVSVASLTVVGPTLGNVNEPNATATSTGVFYGVVTGVARPFREPGIQAPDPPPSGSIPPIPRFDSNPETIRVDSDALGGTAVDVKTGAIVTGLVGPLDFGFRKYTVLPDPTSPLSVNNLNAITATPVTTPMGNEFTVASYNLERFFDTVNDPGIGEPVLTATAFDNRLNKASLGIRNYLKFPDILGVVEVENLTTLQALATRISNDAMANGQPDPMYTAHLVEGNDVGGIDVGFLVKTSPVTGMTPRVTVNAVVQENAGELFVNPDSSTSLLNDRPPLRLDATINFAATSFPVTVIVNHLRSLNGVNDIGPGSSGWATEGERVRAKRQKQAESLANLVQARQTANPLERIILVGDFNAFEFNDGLVDSMNVIGGTPPPDNETAVPGDGVDLVNPDLVNLFNTAPASERYSFVFDGNAQSLDHILANQSLISNTPARRVEHPRINADFPETARNGIVSMEMNVERLSDHDPIVGFFTIPAVCTVTCPPNVSQSNDSNQCGAIVNYSTPTTSGPCGTVTCSPAAGSFFPVGTTTVTCTSSAGPSCMFTVTVNDTQAPTITCPSNIVKSTDPNQCQAVVTYPAPTVTDNCSCGGTMSAGAKGVAGNPCVANCSPASGSNFPKGVTTVTCTTSDTAGNPASCTFTVTVQDTQQPTITCPANATKSTDPNQCSAVVTFTAPTVSDNCPGFGTPTCTPASGFTFPKGTTTVNCMVADASSNQASCSFTVTVNDTQAPSVTCPANIVKNTDPNQCSAVASFSASASDNCPGVGVACSPASGSAFPKGTTTVTCTATDTSNNSTICRFTVTVNDTQPPTITCPTNVTAVTPAQGGTGAVITYPAPTVSDNCPGATSTCNPPSGSTFPVGCTVVACTATDTSGNTAMCFFNVCVFNVCLQDDSNPNNRLIFNTATGDYRFCCNGMTFTGKGKVTTQGSTYTLEHNTLDRRLLARATSTSGGNGTASLQSPPGRLRCSITDSNSSNNTTCATCQ